MRRFIYLDTDTLNSYLAQMFDGLIQSHSNEKEDAIGKENQNVLKGTANGELALKLFGKGIDASLEAAYERLKTVTNEETFRDVQTKIMHDNAFDHFFAYLEEKELLNAGNEIGRFISINDEFYIFDIEFYQHLFDKNGFVSMLEDIQKEETEKELKQQFEGLDRAQRRDNVIQNRLKEAIKKHTEETHKEYAGIKKLLDLFASIIPYPQILRISNYIVVLNQAYLRDSLKTAAFKYGGKVNVVGYITNKVTSQAETPISAFSSINQSLNTIMNMFFDNANEMYIVHPVAIYYNN